ncbi:MAG: BTAD domain-containing putative transcriptional regulator [Caldilineaceae bacterium]
MLRVHLFGAPVVQLDGTTVDFGRHKALALLAYLAAAPTTHGRDSLAALLWPELSQQQARAALRRTLVALTQAIGKQWIGVTPQHLALLSQPGLWVDLWRFHELLAMAAAHSHGTFDLCDECLAALTEAGSLYCDDFMAGFSLRDAPSFDEWQRYQAESLRLDLAAAQEALACGYAGRRQFDKAIACGRRRLTLDPLHEGAQRLLMRLYTWAGDRVAALHQANECSRLLALELDAAPQVETIELADAIRAGRPLPVTDEAGADHSSALLTPLSQSGMPLAYAPFYGREVERAHIAACLADPACRLLTILGPGGAGKTRLAVKATGGQGAIFADGVHFISLAGVAQAELMAGAILHAVAAPVYTRCSAQEQVLDFLRNKQMLLILDSFEQLTNDAGPLLCALAAAPALKLLVTSRIRLNLRDEWLVPLAGLTVPSAAQAAGPLLWSAWERCSAVQLFLSGLHRLHPGFQPAAADVAAIVHICQLLEGLPLAIELAVAHAHTLSLPAILDAVEHDLDFFTAALHDLPERQRSLRAVFEDSWRLLTPRQRSVLCKLAGFPNSFTPAVAADAVGASLTELSELVDHSWLLVDPDGAFTFFALGRRYCREKLSAKDAHHVWLSLRMPSS